MTMIVERSLVDIRSDSSTMCANSDHQLTRSEESNGDIELEKLDFSDCESSSERSSGTSINIPPYKNEHISQYHSIQQLCTPTSSCSKTEEGTNRDLYQNSFNCPGVKVKTEGCPNYRSHTRESWRDVLSDEDFPNDELSSKRQRLAEENSESFNHLTDIQYRPKRKQTQPKHCDEGAMLRTLSPNLSKKSMLESLSGAHRDLQGLQRRLNLFKKRYEGILFEDVNTGEEASFETDDEPKRPKTNLDEAKPSRMEALVRLLKSEVSQNMEIFVDHVVRQFVQRNQQQLNLALQQPKLLHVNSSDEHSNERTQDVFENLQKFSTSEQIHSQQEKPLNYSLQISNKKDDFSGQESYKTYLRQLANSNYKALYPLSNIQSMIPMFLPPFNPGYMFHNSNVYHPLFYHSSQKPQETLKRESSASTSLISEPEQSEAIPLVVNPQSKKKRTKVTDSRFSPRIRFHQSDSSEPNSQLLHSENSQNLPEKRMLSYETKSFSKSLSSHQDLPSSKEQCTDDGDFYKSPFQAFIASSQNINESDVFASVYKQNASSLSICEDLQNHLGDKFPYEAEHRGSSCHISGRPRSVSVEELKREDSLKLYKDSRRSRGFTSTTSETGFEEQLMTSTLTPMHLRKAKLMFFYVRYPSSSVLKTYFPDVFFNKNNTAQLIKWFSNFREFYYIQMEKFARQAVAEGVGSAANLHVSKDSELYRILVLHYNRNNRIEVPENFRATVQATLREFFKAIQAERDQEQSWKKAIYKVIARLDDMIPEHFKRTNWMEELADQ